MTSRGPSKGTQVVTRSIQKGNILWDRGNNMQNRRRVRPQRPPQRRSSQQCQFRLERRLFKGRRSMRKWHIHMRQKRQFGDRHFHQGLWLGWSQGKAMWNIGRWRNNRQLRQVQSHRLNSQCNLLRSRKPWQPRRHSEPSPCCQGGGFYQTNGLSCELKW